MSVISMAKNANDFSESDMKHFAINWRLTTTKEFFGTKTLPTPNFDASVLDEMSMLKNPTCTAEAVQLRRYLMEYNNDDEDCCLDYADAMLRFCGYLVFPRYKYRKRKIPFCSYKMRMECRVDYMLLNAKIDRPLLLVMTSQTLVEGIPKVFAAAVALYRYYELGKEVPVILVVKRIFYFFRIKVTPQLVKCIEHGTPSTESVMVDVYSPLPTVPSEYTPLGLYADSELPALFRAMEAFKKFLLNTD